MRPTGRRSTSRRARLSGRGKTTFRVHCTSRWRTHLPRRPGELAWPWLQRRPVREALTRT